MSISVPRPSTAQAAGVRLSPLQERRLRDLLTAIDGRSEFYTRKLEAAGIDANRVRLPEDFTRIPLTTKAELVNDQQLHPPWGTVLSEPRSRYTRYSQTSSTTGVPLRWLDTAESWQTLVDCWKTVFRGAGLTAADRVFFAFSFGPFAGFWIAFEAACQLGMTCIPGGGMSSDVRLRMIDSLHATVVCCTPTYALRLAEVAEAEADQGRSLRENGVKVLIVAGEPGGSIPATRQRIERSWNARVIDHHGLTEVGSISFECLESPGALHVIEREYICEVLDPETGLPVPDGTPGELVVTNLRRTASPALRYRTGDMVVRMSGPCRCGRPWARLEGGILGRIDDMVCVRGVNIYPSAIESVVRRYPEVIEFRSIVSSAGAMRSVSVELECASATASSAIEALVSRDLQETLGLSVAVTTVAAGTLPRFEMKSRRIRFEG
jgi:phenylacetate-CoA ligase